MSAAKKTAPAPAEKTAPAKKSDKKRINRSEAATRVIAELKGSSSLREIAEKANALFVEHGGKDSIEDQISFARKALETAEVFGIVRLTRPTDITVEKI